MKLLHTISSFFRRRRFESEMAEEMRLHLEARIQGNMTSGMSAEEARTAALRQFGGVEQTKEQCRDGRPLVLLEQVAQDCRYAARSLRNHLGFTSVVVTVLAMGIGANSAVFSVVYALLLRPLPIPAPERLMVLAASGAVDDRKPFPYPLFDKEGPNLPMPYPFFEQFRDQAQSTVNVAAVSGWPMLRPLVLPGDHGAKTFVSVQVEEVSGSYFSAVGVDATLGRTLNPPDDQPGNAAPVAVISHAFWRERFGSDPGVIGQVVNLDQIPLTIVGVAPPRFGGAQVGVPAALWVPINLSTQIDRNAPWGVGALASRTTPWIHVLARLKPESSPEQATAELDVAYQRKLAELDPRRAGSMTEKNNGTLLEQSITLLPAGSGYAGVRTAYQRPAAILMGMVGFMQLIACANVAGLMLARGTSRQKEFALRAALGAGRGRLIRQMLTESMMLAALAGAIGMLLAHGGTRILSTAVGQLGLWADWRVLGFTFLISVGSGLAFGLFPAVRLSKREFTNSLKQLPGLRQHGLNSGLVVAQVALAFALVAIAGLFSRTFYNLVHADTGFEREHRLLFDLNVSSHDDVTKRFALYREIGDAIGALPGVETASIYQGFSLLGDTAYMLGFSVPGTERPSVNDYRASIARIGPHFFEAMGIPLLRGSDFDWRIEQPQAKGVLPIVISEWSARRLFGDDDPLGRRIRMNTEFEIVGVAKDVKYGSMREDPKFVFYVPLHHRPNTFRVTFLVKSLGTAAVSADVLRDAIRGVDAEAQISGLRTIDERISQNVTRDRLIAMLAGFFGLLALVFAGMGLFGLMCYVVGRRTKEFGVRMALGASRGNILRIVMRQGFLLGVIGTGVGLAVALGLSRLTGSLLYGIHATDFVTFLVTSGGTILVMTLASFIPARRAVRLDPVAALRAE